MKSTLNFQNLSKKSRKIIISKNNFTPKYIKNFEYNNLDDLIAENWLFFFHSLTVKRNWIFCE